MLSRPVAEEMWGLLQRLQQDGREVVENYLELCMKYRFFRCLANRLMVAIAMGVSGISRQQPKLWKHTMYIQKNELHVRSRASRQNNLHYKSAVCYHCSNTNWCPEFGLLSLLIPPLCISSSLRSVQALLFDYIIAVYPIILCCCQ